jgi:hypothetical protein
MSLALWPLARCLGAGLLFSLGIAWGDAVLAPLVGMSALHGGDYAVTASPREWTLTRHVGPLGDRCVWSSWAPVQAEDILGFYAQLPWGPEQRPLSEMLPQWTLHRAYLELEIQAAHDEWFVEDARGFPWRCFWGGASVVQAEGSDNVTPESAIVCEPPTDVAAGTSRLASLMVLPYRPLWPGLLANTAFYAVILWALWFTPGAVRRGLRRRRGACVRCGYDLRGAEFGAACPECGGE